VGKKWGRKKVTNLNRAASKVVGLGDVRQWDAHAARHCSDLNGTAAALMGHLRGTGAGRMTGGPARYAQHIFLFIQMFSNRLEFEPVKRWPSDAQKFSNQISNCRELHKELFKLQNGI
jgi:hypothetical protein